ncbi:hypothetical protein [uncultured Lacinutrix sp.]|uniref:hypothetical protein n=1 Tax=uncultured Lacinutrix sp. TaxID=574032 RepID=UPI00260C638D|nr:hypothetical protein [uncultured Lacinutrix sp.]
MASQNEKIKLKTYKTKNYSIKYPKSWYKYNWHGSINFSPKEIRKKDINPYNNHIYIIKLDRELSNSKTLEEIVEYTKGVIVSHTDKVNHVLKKYKTKNGIMYSLELASVYRNYNKTEIHHFYKIKGIAYDIIFSFDVNYYKQYLDEGMSILNSIEFK